MLANIQKLLIEFVTINLKNTAGIQYLAKFPDTEINNTVFL